MIRTYEPGRHVGTVTAVGPGDRAVRTALHVSAAFLVVAALVAAFVLDGTCAFKSAEAQRDAWDLDSRLEQAVDALCRLLPSQPDLLLPGRADQPPGRRSGSFRCDQWP
ncbi:hypothetical protein VT52_030700 [Streptomyces malaysiense]|uniref:Uncharacterized protein n=1 Tax=Streptomyces malaysiense TaxID=1428626 RepID=A0A1J4PS10_9ACTN|nr:hypothetical protein VT52_030700 [Streptomyces malaysiense]